MRAIIVAAVAALAFTSAAPLWAAEPIAGGSSLGMDAPLNLPAGPYKLDAAGKCHAANGKFVKAGLCAAPAKHCTKGKLCGNACIKASDVCHKP